MAARDTSEFTLMEEMPHYFEFEWSIDNISTTTGKVMSPQFCVADGCSVKWALFLDTDYEFERMMIHLQTSDKTVNNLKVNFCYKLFSKGLLFRKKSVEGVISGGNKISASQIFLPQCGQQCLLQGHITVYNCCQKKSNYVEMRTNKYAPELQIDFKSLLKSQEFTDVVLNVGNEVIRAHKFVLCARSPVFKTMFQQDFKEAVNISVDVNDMEKSVLEIFLEFLYFGVVGDRKFETVTSLYSAADKYEVETLQEACREILISYMSVITAPVILKLADMHNDDNLKEITIGYIHNNFDKIQLTPEWEHLLNKNPQLASYTLRRVSQKCENDNILHQMWLPTEFAWDEAGLMSGYLDLNPENEYYMNDS